MSLISTWCEHVNKCLNADDSDDNSDEYKIMTWNKDNIKKQLSFISDMSKNGFIHGDMTWNCILSNGENMKVVNNNNGIIKNHELEIYERKYDIISLYYSCFIKYKDDKHMIQFFRKEISKYIELDDIFDL